MHEEENHLKLIVTIVDRGKAKQIVDLYKKHNLTYHFISLGRGTAKTELLDYLGLGENEKDIVFSIAEEKSVPEIWQILNEKLHFNKAGHGVAFTIPVTAVGGKITLSYFLGLIGKEQK